MAQSIATQIVPTDSIEETKIRLKALIETPKNEEILCRIQHPQKKRQS
jgi:hypothetical protein